ncbi:unnamed protein product, partial [Bubo scandiacus]
GPSRGDPHPVSRSRLHLASWLPGTEPCSSAASPSAGPCVPRRHRGGGGTQAPGVLPRCFPSSWLLTASLQWKKTFFLRWEAPKFKINVNLKIGENEGWIIACCKSVPLHPV